MAYPILSLSFSNVNGFMVYTVYFKVTQIRRSRRELCSTSLFYPSLIECMIEKISQIGMKVRWHPILLEVDIIFILKDITKMWNHDFQHSQVSLTHDSLFEELRIN